MRPKYSDKNALRFWMDANDALRAFRQYRKYKIRKGMYITSMTRYADDILLYSNIGYIKEIRIH